MTTIKANSIEQNRDPLGGAAPPAPVSRAAWWTGWIISAIPILMMGGMGAAILLFSRGMARDGMTKYGYPATSAIPILIVEVVCAVLYAIPRTAVLGAVLLTGYLGGAVATHVHASESWVFPVIAGVLVWLGLYLRDARVRDLLPLRRPSR
jgi:ABC-type sugar transport system permease subunit